MQGIELLQGDVWGHRKDLDEYFTIEEATIEEIRSLAASGARMDDVADKIQKKTRLNPDLIKYVAKTKITAWALNLSRHFSFLSNRLWMNFCSSYCKEFSKFRNIDDTTI